MNCYDWRFRHRVDLTLTISGTQDLDGSWLYTTGNDIPSRRFMRCFGRQGVTPPPYPSDGWSYIPSVSNCGRQRMVPAFTLASRNQPTPFILSSFGVFGPWDTGDPAYYRQLQLFNAQRYTNSSYWTTLIFQFGYLTIYGFMDGDEYNLYPGKLSISYKVTLI